MLTRNPQNPILTRSDVPPMPPDLVDVTSVFNPGAIKMLNTYYLVTRVQSRSRETCFVVAESGDGTNFTVHSKPVVLKGMETLGKRVYHVYDARLTRFGNTVYMMFAMDMEGSCQLGLATTGDFRRFQFLGIVSDGDTRNGVIFPERINGKFMMLDRPNLSETEGGVRTGSTIYLSESDDMMKWKRLAPVMSGRFHYWDEFIGSGPPPVKTRQGWLHVYHGVASHFGSANIYQGGVILLDLKDPSKLIGRSRCNILEPREIFELAGQVPNVCFPSGLIVEHYDAEGYALPESPVKIYYGAADTSVGLAHTTIQQLIDAAMEGDIPVIGM
jgi:beta-1,4-mannooligosaccharide/beta-1,4-mannosyl-N-acetylglucosamine phosphorylase